MMPLSKEFLQRQSMNVIYLNDDVDYQAVCGSTALAATLARSSLPGLRYIVRGGGVTQRGVWMIVLLVLMLIAAILIILYVIIQSGY